MSSNHNDINNTFITRDNYEEAFLLYVDDELTAEEKRAVEAFVLLHPDLGEELDVLLSTKLPVADIRMEDKQSLFADSLKRNTIDESLLLYIDNELAPAEQQAVATKIKEDKDYSLQHHLLLKTKLDKGENIIYPYKEELYRKSERRIYAGWWRVAAAAVIVLWAGTFDWYGDEVTTAGPVALQPAPAPAAPVAVSKAPATTPDSNKNKVTAEETTPSANAIAVYNTKASSTTEVAVAHSGKSKTPAIATTASPAVTEPAINNTVAAVHIENASAAAPQQIINNGVVTSDVTPAYIPTEASHTALVPADEVTASNNEKGGSIKGFLRKTTRFIERTTNINPVNADDELLIGAISIKLK